MKPDAGAHAMGPNSKNGLRKIPKKKAAGPIRRFRHEKHFQGNGSLQKCRLRLTEGRYQIRTGGPGTRAVGDSTGSVTDSVVRGRCDAPGGGGGAGGARSGCCQSRQKSLNRSGDSSV